MSISHLSSFPIQMKYLLPLKSNILFEPLVRIELTTSSLPRKCSTTELQRLFESLKSVCQASQMGKPLIILTHLTKVTF